MIIDLTLSDLNRAALGNSIFVKIPYGARGYKMFLTISSNLYTSNVEFYVYGGRKLVIQVDKNMGYFDVTISLGAETYIFSTTSGCTIRLKSESPYLENF